MGLGPFQGQRPRRGQSSLPVRRCARQEMRDGAEFQSHLDGVSFDKRAWATKGVSFKETKTNRVKPLHHKQSRDNQWQGANLFVLGSQRACLWSNWRPQFQGYLLISIFILYLNQFTGRFQGIHPPWSRPKGVVGANAAFGGKNEGHPVQENPRSSRDARIGWWNHPQETPEFVSDCRRSIFLPQKHPGLLVHKMINLFTLLGRAERFWNHPSNCGRCKHHDLQNGRDFGRGRRWQPRGPATRDWEVCDEAPICLPNSLCSTFNSGIT